MNLGRGGDDDDDQGDGGGGVDPYPATLSDRTESRVYLSSRFFMQHFAAQFYELARRIGKGGITSGARLLDPR